MSKFNLFFEGVVVMLCLYEMKILDLSVVKPMVLDIEAYDLR